MKRLVIQLSMLFCCGPAFGEQSKHFVIRNGEFESHLSAKGRLGSQPDGTLLHISFEYDDFDRLHPYLIADLFCRDSHFMKWGSAPHPSQGQIDMVCVRRSNTPRGVSLAGGQ